MFTTTALVSPPAPAQAPNDVVYTATQFYPPNVVEAWKNYLEQELAFFRIHLRWEYLHGQFAQVKADAFAEEVIEEIELSGCTLEQFAKRHKSEERPP